MKNGKKIDEKHLIAMLKARNNDGFRYLYNNYNGALYSFILEFIPNRETAADILHDVFINIFLKINTYDASKNRLYTWMMSIAKNKSIDILKGKDYRNNMQNEDLSTAVTAHVKGISKIDHIGLHGILFKLEEKYRVVLDLNYFKGYTHEEISRILNLPIGTIKTRIRHALRLLRKMVDE